MNVYTAINLCTDKSIVGKFSQLLKGASDGDIGVGCQKEHLILVL